MSLSASQLPATHKLHGLKMQPHYKRWTIWRVEEIQAQPKTYAFAEVLSSEIIDAVEVMMSSNLLRGLFIIKIATVYKPTSDANLHFSLLLPTSIHHYPQSTKCLQNFFFGCPISEFQKYDSKNIPNTMKWLSVGV